MPYKEQFEEAIRVSEGRLPVKYFGIPLEANYLKARNYAGLATNVEKELKGVILSFFGRVELIKTVMLGTLQYWIPSFQFPKIFKSMFSKFLWRVYCLLGHGINCVRQRLKEV